MGNNQASRKLSVENENDPSTVIKVSEKVVQRIRSGTTVEADKELKEQKHRVRSGSRSESSSIDIFQDGVPFVTARMIRQEVEDELQKNNQYWEHRIIALQESQKKINQIMEEEYMKSVENMKRELPKLPTEHLSLPCVEKKATQQSNQYMLSCEDQPLWSAPEAQLEAGV